MELSKPNFTIPMEMFGNAMPAQIPEIQWGAGIVSNFFHNWKLQQVERASESSARIAENKARMAAATMQMMQNFMTFSAETELRFKNVEHQKTMMAIEEQRGIAEMTLIQNEAKLSELELKIKTKELEELLKDGTTQT